MMRRLAEPNASLTGFTLVVSLARFKVSIATFSDKRAPSGSFSGWDLFSIIEEQGDCEQGACIITDAVRVGAGG